MYSVISSGPKLAMSGIKTIVALEDNYQVLIKIVIKLAKIGMALLVAGYLVLAGQSILIMVSRP